MVGIKCYQVACYDMTRDGKCFDEIFIAPEEADMALDYLKTDTDGWSTKFRVFVHFENGTICELILEKH